MNDQERLVNAAGEITRSEFTLGGTTFTIRKMLPMEGFRVLEKLRPGMESALSGLDADASMQRVIVHCVFALPTETIDAARDALFRHVTFRNEQARTPVTLAGMEDTAFMGLEPVHVYEIIIRAFAVNFQGSWAAVESRIPQAVLSESQNTSTSQDSSPSP